MCFIFVYLYCDQITFIFVFHQNHTHRRLNYKMKLRLASTKIKQYKQYMDIHCRLFSADCIHFSIKNNSVYRQVDVNLNSWRETWWCSSMVETFLNTHMTRLSCLYEPAESRTPDNWPCSSDVKVSMQLREKKC